MTPLYDRDNVTIYVGRAEDVLPRLSGITAIVSDPPYGVGFDTDYTRFTGGVSASTSTHAAVAGDDVPFDPGLLLSKARNVVLFGANCYSDRLPRGSWLVWDKRMPTGENLLSDGEVAWWSRGHGVYIYSHMWNGFQRASERGTAFHPTQKPVALMRWVIGRCTKPDDVICDPYMGCGPVLLAARDLGRRCIGIELKEEYAEIAARRLSQQVLPLGEGGSFRVGEA